MSIHHVECAALTTLPASTKLVLMAFADSADKDTRVAFPGMGNVMAWSGLKKSRALEVTRWLVTQGYLVRASGSNATGPKRRAEYLVFPAGCCLQHGPTDGYDGPDPLNTSAGPDMNTANTSGTSDVDNSITSDAAELGTSGTPDPFGPNTSDLAVNTSDFGLEHVRSGPDPSPLPPSVPPPSGGGGGGTNPEEVLQRLGPSWPVGRQQCRRLVPKIEAALAAGWPVERLARHLAANPEGVKAPGAVLAARLDDLPDPPPLRAEGRETSRDDTAARLAAERARRVDAQDRSVGRVSLRELRATALQAQRARSETHE